MLTSADLQLIINSMNLQYERMIRKTHRTSEYHTKTQNQELQDHQKLLQFLMRTRYEWENLVPEESLP